MNLPIIHKNRKNRNTIRPDTSEISTIQYIPSTRFNLDLDFVFYVE